MFLALQGRFLTTGPSGRPFLQKRKKKKRKNRQVSDNLLSLGEAACFFLFIWLLWILVVACGIDPDQGSNPGPLHWECRDTTTGSQGESLLLTLLL